MSKEEAMALLRHIWIYTYGMGSLCATGVCRLTGEEIHDLPGQDFMAVLFRIKSGGLHQLTTCPMLKQ